MILTDRDLHKRISNGELIVNDDGNYEPSRLNCISYDINIGAIVSDEKKDDGTYKNVTKYYLQPGETIFVKSDVKLKLPKDCIGIIYERNSVMRQGLVVDGPVYQPGHETYAFLRVRNIYAKEKVLSVGDPIAQIRFEQLHEVPINTYESEAYQKEEDFRGVQGDVKYSWDSETLRYEKKVDELNEKETRIYANVLTFMGLFISIFSLLTFSFGTNAEGMDVKNIILIDMSVCMIMYLLMGTILIFVNHIKKIKHLIWYWVFAIVLCCANIFLWIKWIC